MEESVLVFNQPQTPSLGEVTYGFFVSSLSCVNARDAIRNLENIPG